MIAQLAREFVLVYEAMCLVLGKARALGHRLVQAARRRWAKAKGLPA